MVDRREEAEEHVRRVADRPDENPLETLPRVGRMIAKLHAALGNQAAAREWFEHSARALASTADERGRVEVLEDYADLLWPAVRRADAQPPAAPPSRPAGHPAVCRLTVHPEHATDLAPAPFPLSVASALARASTLVDFANRPLFVGGELQEMLRQCRAITDAAIIACADNAAPEVLGFWGDYSQLDPLIAAVPGVERIALGRWRDKDVELRARVSAVLDARTTVIALKKLARASLELDAARREERERAALWPLDEPVEARHGLFASQAMLDIVATARKIGPSNTTVLITGETGTGKEVLARIIHDASPRAARPFIPFNCAAVPREMLDSQLFGHRRGAFTGAITHSSGVIRAAAGGTLLLDEIGEVTPDLQPKLLRFLEAQEIQPLGEPRPIAVDVRVLASTNADLGQLLASGRFREDLYYRLNVIRLRVPPLRERREEIPMLVQHFLARFAAENGKDNLRVAEETMEYLLLYRWPGNVRELQNQMRRLAALAENGAVLMPEHLSPEIAATRRTIPPSERDLAPTEVAVRLDQPLAAAVEQIERAIVPWALHSANGRVEVAAGMLGLSRKGLYLKRRRLGLDANDTLAVAPRA
jgi:DNA-binding NtrC family response regulator